MGIAVRRAVTLSLLLLTMFTFTAASASRVLADGGVVNVTVRQSGLNPDAAGTILTIDGTGYTYAQLPIVFAWTAGSTHDLSAAAQLNGNPGVQYTWSAWSDGGAQSHAYTANANETVTAAFTEQQTPPPPQQVQITVDSSPEGSGYVAVDGAPVSTPQTFPWTVGDSHTLAAMSPAGYSFASWSDGGPQAHTVTVPSTDTTYAATFHQQYYLEIDVGVGGSVSIGSGWQDANSQVQITATPVAGYAFASWSGTGAGSYNGASSTAVVTMNGPITETAYFNQVQPPPPTQVQVTVDSSPEGSGFVTVDGAPVSTPQTFSWTVGDSHTLAATPSTVYSFVSWSDGGSQTHSITVPSSATTYTANFNQTQPPPTQYQLVTSANPTAGGSINLNPAGGIYDPGQQVQATAIPSPGYQFVDWTLDGTPDGSSAQINVTMNQAHTLTADFQAGTQTTVTVTFQASGLGPDAVGAVINVDGMDYYPAQLPQSFSWQPGSVHQISATQLLTTTAASQGTEYVWTGWTGANLLGASGSYTTPSYSTTVTAVFSAQYLLTMQVNPASGGTTVPADGNWYRLGTVVQISVTPNAGFSFEGWKGSGSGSYNGNANPAQVNMNGPITEYAILNSFGARTVQVTIDALPHDFTPNDVIVDAVSYTTPQTFNWTIGSSHVVSAVNIMSCSPSFPGPCRYVFQSWNDSGAQMHTIIVPNHAATYDAVYVQQFFVHFEMAASPGTGSVCVLVNQQPRWCTQSVLEDWLNRGDDVQLTATANQGHAFSQWEGEGSGSYSGPANPSEHFQIYNPMSERAKFDLSSQTMMITVNSNPPGHGWVIVDGAQIATPQAFNWTVGSTHNLTAVASISCGTMCQWGFKSWDRYGEQGNYGDYGPQSNYITVEPWMPTSYTAGFTKQYWATLHITPAGSGAVCVLPVQQNNQQQNGGAMCTSNQTIAGWADADSSVQLLAAPYSGYAFYNWAGSGAGTYSGTANPVTISIPQPVTETATFARTSSSVQITVTSNPTGAGFVTVDGVAITTPQTFGWAQGSIHLLVARSQAIGNSTTNSTASSATAFVSWQSPSIGTVSNPTLTYTTPSAAESVVAVFNQPARVLISITASPSATATVIVDGASVTTPITYTWQTGSSHVIAATATPVTWSSPSIGTVGTTTISYRVPSSSETIIATFTNPTPTPTPVPIPTNIVTIATTTTKSTTTTTLPEPTQGVQVTISSNPTGTGLVYVDLKPVATPITYNWTRGTVHTISANSTAPCHSNNSTGCQLAYMSWSDYGTQTHRITVPASPTTYFASFNTQYYLTIQVNGGGNASKSSGWQNSGSQVHLTVSPVNGSSFLGWTGAGPDSYTGLSPGITLTMNGPIVERAEFTIQSQPAATQMLPLALVPIGVVGAVVVRRRRNHKSNPPSTDTTASPTERPASTSESASPQ